MLSLLHTCTVDCCIWSFGGVQVHIWALPKHQARNLELYTRQSTHPAKASGISLAWFGARRAAVPAGCPACEEEHALSMASLAPVQC